MKKHVYQDAIIQLCTGKHLSNEEIFCHLQKSYPRIGIATVYRNVKRLTEEGILRKISTGQGTATYETRTHEHGHVINHHTGQIQDIQLPTKLLNDIKDLAPQKNIESIELIIRVKE